MGSHVRRSARTPLVSRQSRGVRRPAQDRDSVDLAGLLGRPADPSRADAKAVMSMQRQAGNRATVQWLRSGAAAVQRDLSKKVAAPKWSVGRPSSVKAIDAALFHLTDKLAKRPGAVDEIKQLMPAVYKAIAAFRASKDATGKWAAAVAALEGEVQAKEGEVDARIALRQKGVDRYAVFTSLEPELAKYAARQMFDAASFEADATGPSIKAALSGPRGAGGELTDAAMAEMTSTQAGEIDKNRADQDVTFGGLSVDQLRSFMAAHTNELTGKTMYPELKNITDPNAKADAVVTTSMDIGGVPMQVEHNPSDVNLDERLKLLREAVTKITAAGMTVPALKVHLPKYGRSLKLKATDGAAGQISCDIPAKSDRAVFIPPDFMHLSSDVIGTPDVTQVKNPITGKEEYKFSSTGFDPSGAATIVHEFGHALHLALSPSKYHGLWGTSFTGTAPSGKQTSQVANAEVSQYGGKPREFVAEVFLGLIYGKVYSEDVISIYKSFGGPIPPAATIKAAASAL